MHFEGVAYSPVCETNETVYLAYLYTVFACQYGLGRKQFGEVDGAGAVGTDSSCGIDASRGFVVDSVGQGVARSVSQDTDATGSVGDRGGGCGCGQSVSFFREVERWVAGFSGISTCGSKHQLRGGAISGIVQKTCSTSSETLVGPNGGVSRNPRGPQYERNVEMRKRARDKLKSMGLKGGMTGSSGEVQRLKNEVLALELKNKLDNWSAEVKLTDAVREKKLRELTSKVSTDSGQSESSSSEASTSRKMQRELEKLESANKKLSSENAALRKNQTNGSKENSVGKYVREIEKLKQELKEVWENNSSMREQVASLTQSSISRSQYFTYAKEKDKYYKLMMEKIELVKKLELELKNQKERGDKLAQALGDRIRKEKGLSVL